MAQGVERKGRVEATLKMASKRGPAGVPSEPSAPPEEPYNWSRVSHTGLFGALFMVGRRRSPSSKQAVASSSLLSQAPVGDMWYKALDKMVALRWAPATHGFIAAKVLADTFLFGPVYIGAFFAFSVIARGGTLQEVKDKLAKELLPCFAFEAAVWPGFQVSIGRGERGVRG